MAASIPLSALGDPFGAVGGGSDMLGSAASLASMAVPGVGWVSAGLQLLGGVSDMFGGGGKVDNSTSAAYSGMGPFAPTNTVNYRKPFLDLNDPVHIVVAGGLVVVAIIAYKRFK